MALVILPRQYTADVNGTPRVGAKLYVYNAGTNTTRVAYTTKALTIAHTQPIESVEGGIFPAAYVQTTLGDYKIVIQDSDGVQIYSEDNIPAKDYTSADLATTLDSLKRTPAEIVAGVTPVNYAYPPYNAKRYGAVGDGVTPDTVALQLWLTASAGQKAVLPEGTYLIESQLDATDNVYLVGDGRENTYLKYTGSTLIPGGGAMLKFSNRSAFRVSSIGFICTNAVTGNTTKQLHIENCVYFDVDNVSFRASGASSGTNNISGLVCDQTSSGQIPPRGSASIRNILYVVEPTDSGGSSSRAIHIKGHASQQMEFVSLLGEGNLEHAYYGVHFENCANCSIQQWQMRGATNTEIKLENADNTLILAPMIAPAPTTGTGISIDSNSLDTLIINPCWNFSSGAPLASLTDSGTRTNVLVPGAASGLPVRGKHAGSLVVDETDATTSQNGAMEVLKNAAYDRNGLVVRDRAVAATGTKALLKLESGGDSTRALVRADVNGVNVFSITPGNGRVAAPTQMQIPVILTANLPAADANNDGLILIEDAGAGNRNIMIYAGGQRFRIDGGSAV